MMRDNPASRRSQAVLPFNLRSPVVGPAIPGSYIRLSRTIGARYAAVTALLAACAAPAVAGATRDPDIRVVVAVDADGRATADWLRLLRARLSDVPYDSASRIVRPIAQAEQGWIELIESRVPAWEQELSKLAVTFAPAEPPARVTIFLGNRGAHDAFTHDPQTIGFDLSALVAQYGSAGDAVNVERIDRLFRHEYVHLLQKAWMSTHHYEANTPLRAALWEIWTEGLGNYYSLSKRWRVARGQYSAAAESTLARLEPRFVARLAAIARADSSRARALVSDLSWGRFDEKWGAITPALWLDLEMSESPRALRDFVLAGPDGVWDLAARHLPHALQQTLSELRAAAERCGAR
jgi:hypothetical protein